MRAPFLLLLLLAACANRPATNAPSTTPAPTTPTPTATAPTTTLAPASGAGRINGSVAFSGAPPHTRAIDPRGVAYCARSELKDETVVVNNNHTLKNVFVRLKDVPGRFDPPEEAATVTQESCMYRPHVQGIVGGQLLRVVNSDEVLHSVYASKSNATLLDHPLPPNTPPFEQRLNYNTYGDGTNEVVTFKCVVHPWMRAYVWIAPHPFFAVTGDDGSFTIANVPPGSYQIVAWHEKLGVKTATITVVAGAAAQATFSYNGSEQ